MGCCGAQGNTQAQPGPASLKASRPNIIFFLADDQSRFDHSAYGNENAPTPTTGAFAKEELYDHQNDPNEWTNQVKNPEFESVLNTLRTRMDEALPQR